MTEYSKSEKTLLTIFMLVFTSFILFGSMKFAAMKMAKPQEVYEAIKHQKLP